MIINFFIQWSNNIPWDKVFVCFLIGFRFFMEVCFFSNNGTFVTTNIFCWHSRMIIPIVVVATDIVLIVT